MASLNNLLISFNFDNVTGSSASGGIQPYDLIGEAIIKGVNFEENTSNFLLKEEILINKLQPVEIIDGSETISVREEDDLSVSPFRKPTSVKLLLENSMYQIISDEMLNMFSTIDNYVVRFSEPANKYKVDYSLKESQKLKDLNKKFFSKINSNPNLEKYIEFYKWIDSSLGYMLQQLIPENSSNENGLKISVESHVLERNKFTHPLPLTSRNNKSLNSGIVVLKHNSVTSSLSRSLKEPLFTATIGDETDIVATKNILNKNYKKNYDFFQTSGKQFNNLGTKTKSVIQSNFSAGDGLSELNRDTNFEEFSIYNSLNNRAKNVRNVLNTNSSQPSGLQGTASIDFADNNFIQRAVPYTSSNYYKTGSVDLKYFFNDEIKFRQQNNILLEETIYRKGVDDGDVVIEPAISYNVPAKHLLKINSGLQDIEIYSPYTNLIETFSPRTLNSKFFVFEQKNITNFFLSDIQTKDDKVTFAKKINLLPNVKIKKYEILENIFPRKDVVGLANSRTKPNFEEVKGVYNPLNNTWSDNSYNNKSSEIRSFWKDSIANRKTTAGFEAPATTIGGYNCLGFANNSTLVSGVIEDRYVDVSFADANTTFNFEYASASNGLALVGQINKDYVITFNPPFFWTLVVTTTNEKVLTMPFQLIKNGYLYNSFYSLDAQNDIAVSSSTENSGSGKFLKNNKFIENDCVIGDLGPNSTFENYKFVDTSQIKLNPKAQFVFNNYFPHSLELGTPSFSGAVETYSVSTNPKVTASFFANDSYQNNLDSNLKPFYNSYVDYFENIKHKSQTHSILPEFTIHRNNEIVKGIAQYELCINGNEKYDELNNLTQNFSIQEKNAKDDFIIDFKKIVDPKTNKIKFTLSGVKKLLPYNGFYPNQRIPQIVTLFSSSYFESSIYSASLAETALETPKRQIHTILQPFFAPGILHNSIKAGLAVDFPLILTGNINQINNSIISSAYYLPNFYSGSDVNLNDSLITINTITKRLPFEAIINPKNYLDTSGLSSANNFLYHADPLIHYINSPKKSLLSETTITTQHSPRYDINEFKETDELYKKAINNFLAETPNFFLNKSQLTYFVSEPESKFKQVTAGTIYQMRVNIAKSPNFSMFVTGADNFIPVESLFGPPCKLGDTPALSASLYQPYCPSYFRKNSNIVIAVTASRTGTPTLQELQSSYNIYEDTSKLTNVPTNLNPTSSTAFINRMKLDSSLYLFDQLESKKLSFDTTTGKPTSTSDAQTSDKKWVIKTKFESPLINFSRNATETNLNNTTNNNNVVYYRTQATSDIASRLSASYAAKVEFKYSSINGIWNRLGRIPQDQNSVQISLSDEGLQGNSLLEVCGFRRESKTISQLADRKVISEGVLMLPFVPSDTQNSVFEEDVRNKKLILDATENKHLFTIPETSINNVLKTKNYKSLSIWEIKKIIESNEQINNENIIIKTISAMLNYNVPMHLNWLRDSQITPCVFYVAEFTHTLSKQDLANIWQGTLPAIGLVPEQEEITIEHPLSGDNFFANIRNRMQLYNIKLKIFKIKKRAKISYEQTLEDVEDNLKFSIQKLDYWYSYNWPYDYFSLVELINIKAGEVFESPEFLREQAAAQSGQQNAVTPITANTN